MRNKSLGLSTPSYEACVLVCFCSGISDARRACFLHLMRPVFFTVASGLAGMRENRAVYVKSTDGMMYLASCFVKLCLSRLSAICVRRRCESRNITFVLAVDAESEVSL